MTEPPKLTRIWVEWNGATWITTNETRPNAIQVMPVDEHRRIIDGCFDTIERQKNDMTQMMENILTQRDRIAELELQWTGMKSEVQVCHKRIADLERQLNEVKDK